MNPTSLQQGTRQMDGVTLASIAQTYGTPCYVYSHASLVRQWQQLDQALGTHPHQICYSVKANSNLAILQTFAQLGSGFDIVSVGELARVIAAGGQANKIVFSGVAKQAHEIQAALKHGIGCFNVESAQELALISQIAKHANVLAPIALRINPDVDSKSHPFIATGLKESKFGVPMPQVMPLYLQAHQDPHLAVTGIACHIGSQITQLGPFADAFKRVFATIEQLKQQGIFLKHVDLGGGLGVAYHQETLPSIQAYAQTLLAHCQDPNLTLMVEPGRSLVANAGVLLTQVLQIKPVGGKSFCIVDAAINDLLRPALYQAWHDIIAVTPRMIEPTTYDVVGPICESGDFLALDRSLAVEAYDILAIMSAGAYAFSMSSNYNSRPRACEILVKDGRAHVIRQRETIDELFANERTY